MNNKVKVFKNKYGVLPTKTHDTSVGYDVMLPNLLNEEFVAKMKELNKSSAYEMSRYSGSIPGKGPIKKGTLVISAHSSVLIPTGIFMEMDDNVYIDVRNRSSIASKYQLVVGAEIIDPEYRGEIFINLHNISGYSATLYQETKIAQFILHERNDIRFTEVERYDDLSLTERGHGGFGSTDQ
jgi:dUTP pyrophosphatase